jgi:hypothetical protein
VPALWLASVGFFGVNVAALGLVVSDIGGRRPLLPVSSPTTTTTTTTSAKKKNS